jgi:hypothetical protein
MSKGVELVGCRSWDHVSDFVKYGQARPWPPGHVFGDLPEGHLGAEAPGIDIVSTPERRFGAP